MKHYIGKRPHPKMQANFLLYPETTSTQRKDAVNRLIAKYGLKEKDEKVG